ncbi:MAG: hypothetical protein JNM84_18480 [Planctomycetes bacterium]|nr:hypothetical protein [Planctomycetota bacterium]
MTLRSALRTCGSAALLVLAAWLVALLGLREPGDAASRGALLPAEPERYSEPSPLLAANPAVQRLAERSARDGSIAMSADSSEAAPLVKLSALHERYAGRVLALVHPELGSPVPDPLEPGACSFLLRLVDASSGEPCESFVQLWRLDAPESETMTRGDQYVRDLLVPREGAHLEDLAAGRYRLVVAQSGASSDDPVPIDIDEGTTECVVPIALPQRLSIELALFDLRGERLNEARAGVQSHSHARLRNARPRWELAVRSPRFAYEDDLEHQGSGGGTSRSGRKSPRRLQANALGWFELGSLHEGTRTIEWPARLDASVEGADGPEGFVFDLHPARTRWVSIVCPKALVLASLRCKDGTEASELAPHLHLQIEALPVALGEESQRWADVPIGVAVRRPEHPPLEFRFTARDLPLPIRWLD